MTGVAKPLDETIYLGLPNPPHSQPRTSVQTHSQENVTITLLNNKEVSGLLCRFIATEERIDLYYAPKNLVIKIRFEQIKWLKLTNPRPYIVPKNDQNHDTPIEHQAFELTYIDDTMETGETAGHILDEKGIHLFLTQAFQHYTHLFVPTTASTSHSIIPIIKRATANDPAVGYTEANTAVIDESDNHRYDLISLLNEDIIDKEQLIHTLKYQHKAPTKKLGTVLIQEGHITPEQLKEALEIQKTEKSLPLGEILTDKMQVVSAEIITKTLASQLGIPFVNLRKFVLESETTKLIPDSIAIQHRLVPLCRYDSKLIIAMENPMNLSPLEDISFHTKMFVEPVMASAHDIQQALNLHYNVGINEYTNALEEDSLFEEITNEEPVVQETDNVLVKLANKMIMDAYQQGASDIHIEPYPGKNKTIIRFRKDGSIIPYVEVPYSYREALISRLKIMCQLDISERRKPQDGKINFRKFGNANIELRVATIPTAGGVEDVVLRVLANGEPVPLKKLGLSEDNYTNIQNLVSKPYGLFLVCGPTGSGKTTTLHSILGDINTPEKKIWTAEDPVEITQRGLRQVQVNNKINLTFANAMRAFLRADPDVIMVGEMRDKETTGTGIEASLTGHLVLSTLHTNGAAESITRLLDMGMDPFNFADALLGILAQRLAKRLCTHCAQVYSADEAMLVDLAREYYADFIASQVDTTDPATALPDNIQSLITAIIDKWQQNYSDDNGNIMLKKAIGCDFCDNTGYSGRLGLHELLIASKSVKKLIQERASVAIITEAAFHEGMHSLKQDGIEKVFSGLTDMLQVRAVCIK